MNVVDLLAYLLAFLLVSAVHMDIDNELAAAAESANMDGSRLLQQTIAQDAALLDRFPPRPCFAEWWAYHRSAIAMLGAAFVYSNSGDQGSTTTALNAARTARWFGQHVEVSCAR